MYKDISLLLNLFCYYYYYYYYYLLFIILLHCIMNILYLDVFYCQNNPVRGELRSH